MSERLNSVEIEDVLSSIRRLVSDDLRPGAKSPEAGVPAVVPAAPVAEVGKLVLTPALRILPDPGAGSSGAFSSVRARDVAPPAYEEDAELPKAGSAGAEGWFEAAEGAAPISDRAEPEVEEVTMAAPVWDRAAVGQAQAADELLSGPAAQAEAGDWLPEAEPMDAAFAAAAEESGMPDMPEPDAAPQPARPQPNADWADAAEAEIRRELEAEAEESVFARFDAGAEAGEPVFDEDMLRDLVRDIIREELQGTLGERITRNVRKLVRAEIARALAVRDFE